MIFFKRSFFCKWLALIIALFLTDLNTISVAKTRAFENPRMINTYGMPGSIDNPSAEAFPDGQFSVSSSFFGGTIRTNLSFQVTNSLALSFRYSRIPSALGDYGGYFWDRSFDIHYLIREQTNYFPSIALGLRDFIGTGLYSGEYFVATSDLNSRLSISGGIGWGRLSGTNKFNNIFGRSEDRSKISYGYGGTFHVKQFFSGNNSPFFSLSYDLSETTEIIAELSSDSYNEENSSPKGLNRKNDLNFGVKYQFAPDFSIIGMLMHGNTFGLTGVLALNPRNSPYKSGIETAPMPFLENDSIIEIQSYMDTDIFIRSAKLLKLDGIILLKLKIDNEFLDAEILDRQYHNVSQMIGRVGRILSKTVPTNVKFFRINMVDYKSGYSVSQVTIDRESLRSFELVFNGPEKLWKTVKIDNSAAGIYSSFNVTTSPLTWSFYPDIDIMLFDPQSPINGSLGWEANLAYRLANSTTINSSIKQALITGLKDIKHTPKSGLPNVRSDFMYYYRDIRNRPYLDSLTIDQHYKPFNNIYGQINFGYLELMYAGIRAEAVWKDVKKPYGIGLDIARIRKRDTFGTLSILSEPYTTAIGTVYYDMQNNWNVKLDAGRYLAGDYGATFSLLRTFNNGWEIGAFATLTNVDFSTFGEGSFDKGITLKAPLSWFTGKKSQVYRKTIIKPITGDGGARLLLGDDKFLYNNVKRYDLKNIKDNWTRVFR